METIKETLLLSNGRLGFYPKRSNLYFLLLGADLTLLAFIIYFTVNRELGLVFLTGIPFSIIFSIIIMRKVFIDYQKPDYLFSFLNKKVDKYGNERRFYLDGFWKLVLNSPEEIKIYKMKALREDYLVQSLGEKKSVVTNNEVIVMWLGEILFHYNSIENVEKELEGLPSSLKIRE